MDHPEIMAALGGLNATAGRASTQLSIVRSQVDSEEMRSLAREVLLIITVLKALLDPDLLAKKPLSGSVQADLIAALSDGVLVFSRLETLLSKLDPPIRRWARVLETSKIKTLRNNGELKLILSTLQDFNSMLCLLNEILRVETSIQIEESLAQLEASTAKATAELLFKDKQLRSAARRLAALNPALDAPDARSSSPALTDELPASDWGADTASSGAKRHSAAVSIDKYECERPEFERHLMASHLYRNRQTVGGSLGEVSTRDSEGQGDGWSYLSHFSLGEVSNIGAVHLPLTDAHHATSDAPHGGSDGEMGAPDDVVQGRAVTIPDSGYGTASKTGTLTYQPLEDQDTQYSDVASVVTDNLSLDLSRDTGNAYVDAFVDRILEATSHLSADEILQTELIQKLPDLLRSFALRVAFAERMTDGRAVGVFTRQNRE